MPVMALRPRACRVSLSTERRARRTRESETELYEGFVGLLRAVMLA